MKPNAPFERRKFPLTDSSFHAGFGAWRGGWSSSGDDDSDARRFHRLSRELLAESARERTKEVAVFGVVLAISAWPVIYMIVSVVKLLLRGHPLDF